MIKVTDARTTRDAAFEHTVTAAGEVLQQELADAGDDDTARRAAWLRYGDAQSHAGTAYRAAQAAEAVRDRECPLCETPAGQPCSPKPAGDHLARWLDSYTAGRLSKQYMRMVVGELVVIDACAVIPAQPSGAACRYCGREGQVLAPCCHRPEHGLACADTAGCRDYLLGVVRAQEADGAR